MATLTPPSTVRKWIDGNRDVRNLGATSLRDFAAFCNPVQEEGQATRFRLPSSATDATDANGASRNFSLVPRVYRFALYAVERGDDLMSALTTALAKNDDPVILYDEHMAETARAIVCGEVDWLFEAAHAARQAKWRAAVGTPICDWSQERIMAWLETQVIVPSLNCVENTPNSVRTQICQWVRRGIFATNSPLVNGDVLAELQHEHSTHGMTASVSMLSQIDMNMSMMRGGGVTRNSTMAWSQPGDDCMYNNRAAPYLFKMGLFLRLARALRLLHEETTSSVGAGGPPETPTSTEPIPGATGAPLRNCLHAYIPESISTLYEPHRQRSLQYDGDAGFDLPAPKDVVVPADARGFKIDLGVIAYTTTSSGEPMAMAMQLRSSTATRTPLRMGNAPALLDANYRGTIIAIVDNLSHEPFQVRRGDRFFQLAAHDLRPFELREVRTIDQTNRGSRGLGSTTTGRASLSV